LALLKSPRQVSGIGASDASTICGSAASTVGSISPTSTEAPSEARLPDVDLDNPIILTDVKPHSKEVQLDPTTAALLEQVRALGQACFKEDGLDGCSKRGGWRINLLAAGLDQGAGAALLGFIVYRLRPDVRALTVAKLAVPGIYRRRGYGRVLMQGLIAQAKQLPEIDTVSLASLPEAITFYQRLNFRKLHTITAKDDANCYFPGQVYMELQTRSRGAPKPKKGGRK